MIRKKNLLLLLGVGQKRKSIWSFKWSAQVYLGHEERYGITLHSNNSGRKSQNISTQPGLKPDMSNLLFL
jgi:hypothetical protein